MLTATVVYVRYEFPAFHRWLDAPDHVAFLRDYHRHIFKIKLGVRVRHSDRDVEFFTLLEALKLYIGRTFFQSYFEFSCEQIACMILREFEKWNPVYCEVSEDGENGAEVTVINHTN
jgi:hypothetical protein